MRYILLVICTTLLFIKVAKADYLLVSRSATIKEDPNRDGAIIDRVEKGDHLLLLSATTENGYYKVKNPETSKSGWIYRTMARRYQGNIPDVENNTTYVKRPPSSFQNAKKLLADLHEEIDYQFTLYCGCPYSRTTTSGGQVDREACGVKTRTNEIRSKRIEWEHVVPASWVGQTRACWKLKDIAYPDECLDKSGRECCESVNEDFELAHNDPNNLFPSVGEVNADRSNHPYGEVPNEPRVYGDCNAEIIELPDGSKLFEPAEGKVRGTVARAMLYMAQVYGVNVELPMTQIWEWHTNNPPEFWEIERAKRIAERTGLYNEWVLGPR